MHELLNLNQYFWLCILTLCLFGCGERSEKVQKTPDFYYPISQFFQNEIQRLTDNKVGLNKTVELNGETETKRLEEVDWKQELQVFIDADINKTAWKDKYEVEERLVDSKAHQQKEIVYRAKDKDLKTQFIKLIVEPITEEIRYIQVTNITTNLVYTSKEVLIYKYNKSYSIEKNQGIKRMGVDKIKVVGELLN